MYKFVGLKLLDSLELGSTDSCDLPFGCWELNPGPLEEQPVV